MTNLQLLPMRAATRADTNAEVVTLDRTESNDIKLRFLSRSDHGRAYARREVTLDSDMAERLLGMLTRELNW